MKIRKQKNDFDAPDELAAPAPYSSASTKTDRGDTLSANDNPEPNVHYQTRYRRATAHPQYKHGHNGAVRTREYEAWSAMKQRCLNPMCRAFKNYGGRGISICQRWMVFQNFLTDMGKRPDGLTLERIDNNLGYEPGNCIWATYNQQALNRRARRYCRRGHEYTPENTLIHHQGYRICRACKHRWNAEERTRRNLAVLGRVDGNPTFYDQDVENGRIA